MATKVWSGATSGAWATAGNWVGGVAPVDGDDVVLNSSGVRSIVGSDESATELHSLTVMPDFGFSVGSSGSPLYVDVNSGTLPEARLYSGLNSEIYLKGDITTCVVASSSASSNAVHLTGSTVTTGALYVVKGAVTIDSGMTVTTTNLVGADATLSIDSSVTMTTLNQSSGAIFASSQAATINCNGGTYTMRAGSGPTTLNIRAGSFIQNFAGDITTINLYGGQYNASGINSGMTITTLNHYGNGAIANLKTGGRLAVTSLIPYADRIDVIIDIGRKWSPS